MITVPSLRVAVPALRFGAGSRVGLLALALYVVPTIFVTAVATWGLGAHRADWHVPFEYDGDDSLLILPMVQGAVETGSFWRHDRLGAPGTQSLGDFPVIDNWHFAALRVLLLIDRDPIWAFNAYHLLTYPLASLVATACFRRLGLSGPAAVATAVLFAFAPYHLSRGLHHYFLSAYYLLPIPLTLAVRFAGGWSPFVGTDGRTRLPSAPALGTLVAGLVTSAAGAYYAFFACVVLAIAGLLAAFGPGRRGVIAAGATVAAIVAGGITQHVPAATHAAEHGHNEQVHMRVAKLADAFGLPLIQLVLPVPEHRIYALARLRAVYEGEGRPGAFPSESVALGTVAAAGWVALVVLALVPGVRPGPVRVLAALTVGVSLVAVTGGGGSLFNYLVTAQVRAYARFAIVLAFFALAAVGFALDRVVPGRLKILACGLLVAFGLWDQTPRSWFASATANKTRAREERFASDRTFFGAMEASLPPGGMVFQLPFVPFPECHYQHVRGVTHTKSLRFSFGAMMGRVEDQWARATVARPTDEMLDRLALRDFVAVSYLLPADPAHLAALTDRLGPGTEDSRKTLVWFDIRPWGERMRAHLGPDEFARRATADREAIGVEWLGPIKSYQPYGQEWKLHVGETSAEIHFVNPTDRVRRVRVTGLVSSIAACRTALTITSFGLTADGAPWRARYDLGPAVDHAPLAATFDLPPGRSGLKIRCDVTKPPARFPHEPDRFAVDEFRVEEIP